MGKTHREVKPGQVYIQAGTGEVKPRYKIEEHRTSQSQARENANHRNAVRSERQETKRELRAEA